MPDRVLTSEQILTSLAETPRRIAELTVGLAPGQLHAPPNPAEWTANDILAHLRACADVWGDCMAMIINQDRPRLRAVSPRRWIKGTTYPEQAFQDSLHAFTAQRTALLAVLEPLRPEAWSRSAMVTGAGRAAQRTVHSYAQQMVDHERSHVEQIQRIASTLPL